MADFDVIVIGSGLGGSSAAAHLAAVGQRVLLLERYSVLGGSSHVFGRRGVWEWDCGVHYVGNCGSDGHLDPMMRSLGIDDRVRWLPLDADGFDIFRTPDREWRVPADWVGYEQNLIAAFPDDAVGIHRMLSVLHALGASFDRDVTPSSTREYRAWARRAGAAVGFAHLPVITLFMACGLSTRLMLALSVYCGLLGSTPTSVTTEGYAILMHHYLGGGAWYPQGGGQALSAAFADVTAGHGGQIRRNAAVEKILVANRVVRGVRLADGEVITAPAVVSAGDLIRTFRDLVGMEHLPPAHRLRVGRFKMGLPFINGYFGIDMDLSSAPNSNFFTFPTWDDAKNPLTLAAMERALLKGRGHRSGEDWARQTAARIPTFVQSSSRRDPSHAAAAPSGHSTVEVQSIVPFDPKLWGVAGHDLHQHDYAGERVYATIKKILIEGLAQRMEMAFPGSSSKIVIAELGTPAAQVRFVGNSSGAPFGLDMSATQTGPLRPGVTTPIQGLYLAGTSTAWGPATEGAMLSGRQAASAITGRDLGAEARAGTVFTDSSGLG